MLEAPFVFLLTVIGYLALRNQDLKAENERLRKFDTYLALCNHDLKAENERLRKFDTYYDYPYSPIDVHRCNISGKSLQKNITFNAVDEQVEIIADVEVDDKFRLYITNCANDFHSKFKLGDRFESVTWEIESDCSITFISGFIQSIVSDRLCIQCNRYVLNRKALGDEEN